MAVAVAAPELLRKVDRMEAAVPAFLGTADKWAERMSVARTQVAHFQLAELCFEPSPPRRPAALMHMAVLIPERDISHHKKCRKEILPE